MLLVKHQTTCQLKTFKTMKKIYTAPLTQVVKINAEQVVCNSPMDVKTTAITNDNVSGFTIADKDDEDFVDDLW